MAAGGKAIMRDQENQEPAGQAPPPRSSDRAQRAGGRGRHRAVPRHLEASINMEELRELIGLITANALTDFELEREGFHVKVGRNLFPDQQAGPTVVPPIAGQPAIPTATGAAVQSVPTATPPHPGAHAAEAA